MVGPLGCTTFCQVFQDLYSPLSLRWGLCVWEDGGGECVGVWGECDRVCVCVFYLIADKLNKCASGRGSDAAAIFHQSRAC